jgi:hypothetical protein
MIAVVKFAAEIAITCELGESGNLEMSSITGEHRIDGNGTLLYDALDTSVSMLRGRRGTRFALVLTDGEDSGSDANERELIQRANDVGMSIHAIALGEDVDENALKRLVTSTGGSYYATTNYDELATIYRDISSLMLCQQVLAYRSASFEQGKQNAYLIIRADLGYLRSEAWTRVVFGDG